MYFFNSRLATRKLHIYYSLTLFQAKVTQATAYLLPALCRWFFTSNFY